MGAVAGIISAINELLKTLIATFGPWGTPVFLIALYLMWYVPRWLAEKKKDREKNALVAAKEAEIQRINEENRDFRLFILKHCGIPAHQAEMLVKEGKMPDAQQDKN